MKRARFIVFCSIPTKERSDYEPAQSFTYDTSYVATSILQNSSFYSGQRTGLRMSMLKWAKNNHQHAIFLGRSDKLPIADYKSYSDYKWNIKDFFDPIIGLAAQQIEGEYVCCAADDTKVHEPRPEGRGMIWEGFRTPPKFGSE